jgi:hypothetical protein
MDVKELKVEHPWQYSFASSTGHEPLTTSHYFVPFRSLVMETALPRSLKATLVM